MSVDHSVVYFTNPNVDAGNYQLVDFDCDNTAAGMSPEEVAARLAQYFKRCGEANVISADTHITQILYRAPGSAGATPIVPDPAFTAAAVTYTNASPYNWAVSGWGGFPILVASAGVLAPLGTSVSVSERSAHPGRSGRGRHFLPFVQSGAINGGGTLGTGQQADIVQAYEVLFMGLDPLAKGSVLDEVHPVITNHLRTTEYPITSVKAQPILSNLESRRR
jgi:hypothetical protein